MLSGLGSAVSGLNHAEKHHGPQTAERIVTEAEADKTKANSSLIMRDIRKLLQLLSVLAASSRDECKHHRDQTMTHNHTAISIIVYYTGSSTHRNVAAPVPDCPFKSYIKNSDH